MKTKIIASSLAGLAILGGTVGFAVAESGTATAATTPSTSTTQAAPKDHKHVRVVLRREALRATAKAINITPKELRADLKNGETVSQVATAKGVDPSTVASTLVKDIDGRINTLVSKNKLTQDRATKIEAKVPAAVNKGMNKVFGQHKPAS